MIGVRSVYDMEQEVHVHGLLQGGLEGRNQLGRQVLNKTNRVSQGHIELVSQVNLLGRSIKCRKEFVRLVLPLIRHSIHNGGLTSIGIANQANLENT